MDYHFDTRSFVFGYKDNSLVGVCVIYQGEVLNKKEMFDLFENQANHMITVPFASNTIIEVELNEGSSVEDLMEAMYEVSTVMSDVVQRAVTNTLTDSECQYQIAKSIH